MSIKLYKQIFRFHDVAYLVLENVQVLSQAAFDRISLGDDLANRAPELPARCMTTTIYL